MEIKEAFTDEDILRCWEALHELRPHLVKDKFLPTVKEMLGEGYHLLFIEENGKAAAVCGYRYVQYLYNGKHFYIDDLCTLPEARGKGYGGMLLDFMSELSKSKGFKVLTLDSGHQRFDAHRLYLNKGFKIAAHHFSKVISS